MSIDLHEALRRNNRLWGLIDELRRENNLLSRELQRYMGLNSHAEVMMALSRTPDCLPESIDLGNPPDADESNVEEPNDENV